MDLLERHGEIATLEANWVEVDVGRGKQVKVRAAGSNAPPLDRVTEVRVLDPYFMTRRQPSTTRTTLRSGGGRVSGTTVMGANSSG